MLNEKDTLAPEDYEVFARLDEVRADYSPYSTFAAELAAMVRDEPADAPPTWAHPLGLALRDE